MKCGNHIAIDIGAASGRAIVGRLEDNKLVTEELHRFETGDVFLFGNRIRNLYRWYEEILHALKKYAASFSTTLSSIGVDSMGEDFVLLDQQGNLLKMPRAYRDVPNDERIIQIEEEKFGNESLYTICGNQTCQADSLRQLISLANETPSVIDRASGLLFFGDVFHYFLCGSRSVELSLASYGKLFNQKMQNWEPRIFRSFGIPQEVQPRIVRCGETLGTVYPEICRDVGLQNTPKVIAPCTHDTACAAFAVPDKGNDWLFISSGSWSIMGMETEAPIITKDGWRCNCSNSSMPLHSNMFKNLVAGMWVIQRCQAEWFGPSFEEIVKIAENIHDNQWYFDPDADALYNPQSMTQAIVDAIRHTYGVSLAPDAIGLIARASFESLALKYRFTMDNLFKISKRTAMRIYILGGGSRNHLLNQLTANACGLPVYTGIAEASAVGNLLCQMAGCGEISSRDEAKNVLINTFPTTVYQPMERGLWKRKFEDFLRATGLLPV